MSMERALMELRPDATWYIIGEPTYENLTWTDMSQSVPSKEELAERMALIDAEYDRTEYQRLRRAEYAKLNQFEMQFDDAMNGTTTWIDAINEIKAKYPKPEDAA